jgi:RPA family protein
MNNDYAVSPYKQQFKVGERVVVSARCAGWRNDALGTICSGPESIQLVSSEDYNYWVQFDTPQHDLSIDGPYYKAQILGCCLKAEAQQAVPAGVRAVNWRA